MSGFSYGIIINLFDARVNILALLRSAQNVDVLYVGAGAQQLFDQDLAHETWR